jgi:hypothetical protein
VETSQQGAVAASAAWTNDSTSRANETSGSIESALVDVADVADTDLDTQAAPAAAAIAAWLGCGELGALDGSMSTAEALGRWRRSCMHAWRNGLLENRHRDHWHPAAHRTALRRWAAYLAAIRLSSELSVTSEAPCRRARLQRAVSHWWVEARLLKRHTIARRKHSMRALRRALQRWRSAPKTSRRMVGLPEVRRQIASLLK